MTIWNLPATKWNSRRIASNEDDDYFLIIFPDCANTEQFRTAGSPITIGFDFYQLTEESNLGRLGEKRQRYLCDMPSPQLRRLYKQATAENYHSTRAVCYEYIRGLNITRNVLLPFCCGRGSNPALQGYFHPNSSVSWVRLQHCSTSARWASMFLIHVFTQLQVQSVTVLTLRWAKCFKKDRIRTSQCLWKAKLTVVGSIPVRNIYTFSNSTDNLSLGRDGCFIALQ